MTCATTVSLTVFFSLASAPRGPTPVLPLDLAELSVKDWTPFEVFCVDPDDVLREASARLARGALSTHDLKVSYRLRAQAFLEKGNLKAAIEDFKQLCKYSAEDSDAWAALALSCYNARSMDNAFWSKSVEYARRSVSVPAPTPWAHCVYAQTLMGQDQYLEALKALDTAISVQPNYPLPYYLRGLVAYQKRDMASLLDHMNRFIELEPVTVRFEAQLPFFYRGTALSLLGRPKEALKSFVMGRVLNPKCPKCLWGVWRAHADLGKWRLAVRIAEEYRKRQPQTVHSLLCCAESYVEVGEAKKALDLVARIEDLPISEAKHIVLTRSGEVRRKAGKYTDALRPFDEAIRLSPAAYQPRVAKAFLLCCCPDPHIRNGKVALELARYASLNCKVDDWRKWELNMCLATAYAECGDFSEALGFASKALELTDREAGHRAEYERRLELIRKGMPYRYNQPTKRNEKEE